MTQFRHHLNEEALRRIIRKHHRVFAAVALASTDPASFALALSQHLVSSPGVLTSVAQEVLGWTDDQAAKSSLGGWIVGANALSETAKAWPPAELMRVLSEELGQYQSPEGMLQ